MENNDATMDAERVVYGTVYGPDVRQAAHGGPNGNAI